MVVEGRPLGGERHPDELSGAKSQLRRHWAAHDHLDDVLTDAANALDAPVLAPHAPGPHDIDQWGCSGGTGGEHEPEHAQRRFGAVGAGRGDVMENQAGDDNGKRPVRDAPQLVVYEGTRADCGEDDNDD